MRLPRKLAAFIEGTGTARHFLVGQGNGFWRCNCGKARNTLRSLQRHIANWRPRT